MQESVSKSVDLSCATSLLLATPEAWGTLPANDCTLHGMMAVR